MLDLGDGAAKVEGFREDDFEDLLNVYAVAGTAEDERRLHGLCKSFCLIAYLFLLFSWKVDEMVVLGAYKERDGGFVKTSALPIPLLDAIQGALPCEVEHEEDGNSIVAN